MRSYLRRAALTALIPLSLGPAATRAKAAPPPTEGDTAPDPEPETAADPIPPSPGFWLSLELIGPRGAQIDAAEAIRVAPIVDALPRGGTPPPGELVGRVDTLEQALAWIEQQAFEGGPIGFDGPGPAPGSAPLPGGALLRDHGVHLTALVVVGASDSGGTQAYPWPRAALLPTPARWRPASLAVARAPVFAAPSPGLPPASERYQVVVAGDDLWQLGALDRCDSAGDCLRWAQILVRQADRWFGGWVPAAHVVADRDWVLGPDDRRFALIPSHRDRAAVDYVLIERRGDQHAPPRGVRQAHAGADWPVAAIQILADQLTETSRLTATLSGRSVLSVELATTHPLTR